MLAQLLRGLGVTMKFTWGCLRPGGATAHFLAGVEVGRLRLWGRWASERTLVHYLQEATAFLIRNRLSPESCFLLETLVTEGAFLLEPPALPAGPPCVEPCRPERTSGKTR